MCGEGFRIEGMECILGNDDYSPRACIEGGEITEKWGSAVLESGRIQTSIRIQSKRRRYQARDERFQTYKLEI